MIIMALHGKPRRIDLGEFIGQKIIRLGRTGHVVLMGTCSKCSFGK